MKKSVLLLMWIICILIPMSVTAMGSSDKKENSGVTELQLWHRWSGTNNDALVEVVKLFEAKNPDIKITLTAKPGEYMELLQKMIADLAAGKKPPELFVGGYNLLNYIGSELTPTLVGDIAPNQNAYTELKNKFDPAIFNLGTVDGKQIGVPFALSNIVLFCNMDIFAQAGLSEKDIPQTWDDVFRVGRVIRDKTGKDSVGIQKIDTWPDLGLIFSNGGKLLSADGKQVAFNNPEAVEAITMWQKLHNEKLAPVCTDEELFASFTAGNVAMYNASVMKLASLQKSVKYALSVAKTPSFGNKPRALPAGGAAIISFVGDKSKKDAIWKFLDFATSPEAMTVFTQTGYLCVTKASVPMTDGQKAAYEQIPNAVPWLCWPGGSAGLEIDRLYYNTRIKIIHENVPAGPAFDKLAQECNALLK